MNNGLVCCESWRE